MCTWNAETPANVPAGNYQVLVYTLGFDFQANYQEAFSVTGAGTYPTYHAQGETGLDYTQNPAYRRVTNTVATAHQKGNYVQFDSVSPAAWAMSSCDAPRRSRSCRRTTPSRGSTAEGRGTH